LKDVLTRLSTDISLSAAVTAYDRHLKSSLLVVGFIAHESEQRVNCVERPAENIDEEEREPTTNPTRHLLHSRRLGARDCSTEAGRCWPTHATYSTQTRPSMRGHNHHVALR